MFFFSLFYIGAKLLTSVLLKTIIFFIVAVNNSPVFYCLYKFMRCVLVCENLFGTQCESVGLCLCMCFFAIFCPTYPVDGALIKVIMTISEPVWGP